MSETAYDLYQVDAFTSVRFGGNPAAVVPLDRWLPDATLQAIGAENNLAETAFLVAEPECDYRIRWFTPEVEVDLCGHATLAAAHVLLNERGHSGDTVTLQSRSGPLVVRRDGELLELDFPATPSAEVPVAEGVTRALGAAPRECHAGKDLMCVFGSEAEVRALQPDFGALRALPGVRGVIATAPGEAHDFVSRFFAPKVGVPEDHVTGSAHCALTPYWAARLGRTELRARQVSRRGGELRCILADDRVRIAGGAVTYLAGRIRL